MTHVLVAHQFKFRAVVLKGLLKTQSVGSISALDVEVLLRKLGD